jgi:hypothetical protein
MREMTSSARKLKLIHRVKGRLGGESRSATVRMTRVPDRRTIGAKRCLLLIMIMIEGRCVVLIGEEEVRRETEVSLCHLKLVLSCLLLSLLLEGAHVPILDSLSYITVHDEIDATIDRVVLCMRLGNCRRRGHRLQGSTALQITVHDEIDANTRQDRTVHAAGQLQNTRAHAARLHGAAIQKLISRHERKQ